MNTIQVVTIVLLSISAVCIVASAWNIRRSIKLQKHARELNERAQMLHDEAATRLQVLRDR